MIKNKEDSHQKPIDLTFCFESIIILEEALSKLNYIGNYTYSNSANVMSKSIGQQIDNKMKRQQELEKDFEDLIQEKSRKTDLVDEKEIINLIKKIQKCAENLKASTNNICKSLAENPDIPMNLKKAKDDKNLIMNKLTDIKDDLVEGNLIKFYNIIEEINSSSINIEDKRKKEMSLFEQLRKINDDLTKEEIEYTKDKKNLNNKLLSERKQLAKTKMEENIFKEYRKNQLDALKSFTEANFKDNENTLSKNIEDIQKKKVNNLRK